MHGLLILAHDDGCVLLFLRAPIPRHALAPRRHRFKTQRRRAEELWHSQKSILTGPVLGVRAAGVVDFSRCSDSAHRFLRHVFSLPVPPSGLTKPLSFFYSVPSCATIVLHGFLEAITVAFRGFAFVFKLWSRYDSRPSCIHLILCFDADHCCRSFFGYLCHRCPHEAAISAHKKSVSLSTIVKICSPGRHGAPGRCIATHVA